MSVKRALYNRFHPGWVLVGIAIGLGLQLIAWITGFGLLGGLPSYIIMGIIVGWASPGNTVVEPGVAAFVIAMLGFILDHLLLSVLGIGLILGVGYGLLGLLFGIGGGWLGERLASH